MFLAEKNYSINLRKINHHKQTIMQNKKQQWLDYIEELEKHLAQSKAYANSLPSEGASTQGEATGTENPTPPLPPTPPK